MTKRLVVALALLVTTVAVAPASLRRSVRRQNHARRVMCYTSCPFYRDACRNVFANGCLFKRCTKELVYSCLGNPADAQCARPCSASNPCGAGWQCSGGQCVIQPPPGAKCAQLPKLKRPKPPTTEACGTIFCPQGTPYCDHGTSTCVASPPGCPPGFPTDCGTGFCCPSGDTCNATGCCSAQYPVACGTYCCTPGSTCGQGGCTDPCPADRPVACGSPLSCCAAGSVCGQNGCASQPGGGPTLPPGNYNVTICVSGTVSLPCTGLGTFPIDQLPAFEQAMQGAITQFLGAGGAQGCSIGAGQAVAAGGGVDVTFSATCSDPQGASATETVVLHVRP